MVNQVFKVKTNKGSFRVKTYDAEGAAQRVMDTYKSIWSDLEIISVTITK